MAWDGKLLKRYVDPQLHRKVEMVSIASTYSCAMLHPKLSSFFQATETAF